MNATALLYPVFAMIAVTVVLHGMMAVARMKAFEAEHKWMRRRFLVLTPRTRAASEKHAQ